MDKIGELDNISGVIVVTNDRFFKQFQAWKDDLNAGRSIRIINDLTTSPEDRLGAIGDIHFVLSKEGFTDDFLILGGDNIFKEGLVDFINFAQSKPNCVTIGLSDIKDKRQACHYGVVSLDKANRVIEFCEKPAGPKSSLVAMCLYYFPREKLPLIREYLKNSENSHDVVGAYISWLCRKDSVYGFIFQESWFDIGYSDIYKKARRVLKQRVK